MSDQRDRRIRVASIQMGMDDGGKDSNIQRAAALIDGVDGADLILLPELWNVGYFAFDDYGAQSESLSGPTVSMLREKAAAKSCYLFGGSIVEADGGAYYNTSVLIDPRGDVAGTYRKIHLFGYQSEEARLLTRGESPTVVDTELGKLGLSTCYDLRFPHLYRALAQAGAEVLVVPAAFTRVTGEAHWHVLNRARAIENGAVVVAPCAVGEVPGGGAAYGHSLVVSPWGEVLADGGSGVGYVVETVDLASVAEARGRIPSLEHDRPYRDPADAPAVSRAAA